jgi:hypothetical protein
MTDDELKSILQSPASATLWERVFGVRRNWLRWAALGGTTRTSPCRAGGSIRSSVSRISRDSAAIVQLVRLPASRAVPAQDREDHP